MLKTSQVDLTMVKPQLKLYASDIWDPHHTGSKESTMKSCSVGLDDYGTLYNLVTSMLDQLSWPTLHTHCKLSGLQTLHKVFYHQYYCHLQFLHTIYRQHAPTRQNHPLHLFTSNLLHLTKIVTSQKQ